MRFTRSNRGFFPANLARSYGGTDAAQVFAVSLSQTRPERNGVRRVTRSVRRDFNVSSAPTRTVSPGQGAFYARASS